VLLFAQTQEKKTASESIASDHAFFEIDRELDIIFDKMQDELEENGVASPENIEHFHAFCDDYGEKVDRIGRFLRIMEARTPTSTATPAKSPMRSGFPEGSCKENLTEF